MLKEEPLIDGLIKKDGHKLVSWKERLRAVGKELETLGKTTEHAFLSVGARLTYFYDRALAISKQSSAVAAGFSGTDVAGAIQGLGELVDRSGSFLAKTEEDFNQDVVILQDILGTIGGIEKPIAGFKKIVKNLSILSISTKIESAQLQDDGHDFTTIAEDVERLSVLISSIFVDIMARVKGVSRSVEQALSGVRAIETRQEEKARSILDRTRATVTSLTEKNASSTETVNRISQELETITRDIGEVVSSVQFHDITRQQVEHVKEALDAAAERLAVATDAPESISSGGVIDEVILGTRAICALQKAQLADSDKQFAGATKSIRENLKSIAATITGAYSHLERLAGMENESSSSFFSKIENEVSSAVSFLREMGDGIRELLKTVEDLTETVRDMSKFVEDIENIGMDIELIAVNARIKAAHTGSEGAPLGIIAEAIQKLSVEAQVQKNRMADELNEIISTVDRLQSRTRMTSSEEETETDAMLKDLDALLGGLKSVNTSALSLLSSVQEEGRGLAADMESTADSITVEEEFAKKVSRGIESIEAVIAESLAILPEGGQSAELEMLKNLEENYTMHSERNIHKSYQKSNGAETSPDLPLLQAGVQHEAHFADNVELF